MEEKILIPYETDISEEYFDAYSGVMILGKRDPKNNRVASASKVRGIAKIRAAWWLMIAAMLWVYWLIWPFEILRWAILLFGVIATLILLFRLLVMSSVEHVYKILTEQRSTCQGSGTLTFDSEGYTDVDPEGRIIRILWSDYLDCLILSHVTVLRSRGGYHIHIPAAETQAQLECALQTFGKAQTIRYCTYYKQ